MPSQDDRDKIETLPEEELCILCFDEFSQVYDRLTEKTSQIQLREWIIATQSPSSTTPPSPEYTPVETTLPTPGKTPLVRLREPIIIGFISVFACIVVWLAGQDFIAGTLATNMSTPTATATATYTPTPTKTVLPTPTKTVDPTSTPLVNPTPTKTTLSQSAFFYEDFSSLDTLSQRWEIYTNGGQLIPLSPGLHLKQGRAEQYPYLVSRVNPFPTNGAFEVKISFRYNKVTNYGTGIAIAICCEPNAQPFEFTSYQPNTLISLFQDTTGLYVLERNYSTVKKEYFFIGKNNTSLKKWNALIKYNDNNEVTVFLNNYQISTVTANQRPNQIWIGNPYKLNAGDWTNFEILSIQVTHQ